MHRGRGMSKWRFKMHRLVSNLQHAKSSLGWWKEIIHTRSLISIFLDSKPPTVKLLLSVHLYYAASKASPNDGFSIVSSSIKRLTPFSYIGGHSPFLRGRPLNTRGSTVFYNFIGIECHLLSYKFSYNKRDFSSESKLGLLVFVFGTQTNAIDGQATLLV